ncbi:MAG: NAD-dependent epimerase/dehydratase family protein [Nitrospinae bacterium]|nr:NAD-dependent epimerase/dehydratase family protein [Nitrospinota bacterium]
MEPASDLKARFGGKNALITGGLGFIGGNLAVKLVELGAHVTILDAMLDGHGGNLFNIEPVKDDVKINFCDIRDEHTTKYLVTGQDYIFHLAGQNDHVKSLQDPFSDIDINIKGAAVLLEACKSHNPSARLIYTGTRGEYGPATHLPVDENAPLNPKGIYELSSLTAQQLFKIYNDNHGIKSVTLRLTNIYGPRAQMRHNRFGVANWFIRLAIDDETIQVFGDGSLKRDFLYVDDTVEAILMCAALDEAYGQLFNLGSDEVSCFRDLAEAAVNAAGKGRWKLTPFSAERATLEPGDFYSDIGKIKRVVGWSPKTPLKTGVQKTVEYYMEHKGMYW